MSAAEAQPRSQRLARSQASPAYQSLRRTLPLGAVTSRGATEMPKKTTVSKLPDRLTEQIRLAQQYLREFDAKWTQHGKEPMSRCAWLMLQFQCPRRHAEYLVARVDRRAQAVARGQQRVLEDRQQLAAQIAQLGLRPRSY
jgi:hypothetical protein